DLARFGRALSHHDTLRGGTSLAMSTEHSIDGLVPGETIYSPNFAAPVDPRAATWRSVLASRIPPAIGEEIDQYENQLELRKQGKLDDKVFAELRLRRGAYGQRYDNGRRYDGVKTQDIPFPRRGLTKGPETEFDAPGMQRIKIPFGKLTAEQIEVLADCAEEY